MSVLSHRTGALLRLAALLAALSLLQARTVAAQLPRPAQAGQSVSARIQALHGAMPPSFDFYINDPCFGVWSIDDVTGSVTVTIMRYTGQPLAHIARQSGSEANVLVQRLAAHTLRFALGGAVYTMQCTASGAMVDRAFGGSHAQLPIRRADPASSSIPGRAPAVPAARPEGRCEDGGLLLYIRQRQNASYMKAGNRTLIIDLVSPSMLRETNLEISCLATAVLGNGERASLSYKITANDITWTVRAVESPVLSNPLLGAWVGVDGRCLGAGWVFETTSVIIYPVPQDRHPPQTFTDVTYNVVDENTVDLKVAGHADARFIIHNDVFMNENCTFVHR